MAIIYSATACYADETQAQKNEYRSNALSFHAGVGYFKPSKDYAKESIFFSGGIKFFLVRDFYLNLQFGHLGIEAKQYVFYDMYGTIITTKVEQKNLYGPSVLLGGTLWLSNSLGVNGALGGSYNMVEIDWTDDDKFFVALDLGLTLKL